jgi:hypothetical protein
MNGKESFRKICTQFIPMMRERSIPYFRDDSVYESVLIEFRIFPHVETVIRNLITQLGPSWCHSVVCGQMNETYMRTMCSQISSEIKIHVLDIENCTINRYNNLFYNPWFWKLFSGEKLLIYQEDTFVFHNKINDFLTYDYIGAPWSRINKAAGLPHQGNGGFSLRNRKLMIHILESIGYNNVQADMPKLHMGRTPLDKYPEDVFFCTAMRDNQLGNFASADVAYCFCTENIVNLASFAGHQFWNTDPGWVQRIIKSINEFTNV